MVTSSSSVHQLPYLVLLSTVLARVAYTQYIPPQPDWLRVEDPISSYVSTFTAGPGPNQYTLTNGLISRTFLTSPDGGFGTIDYRLETVDVSFLRGLGPEARIFFDNFTDPNGDGGFDVGGFVGQDDYLVYYSDRVGNLTVNPLGMRMINMTTYPIVAPYEYKPRWGVSNSSWPPKGIHLEVTFASIVNTSATNFTELDNTMIGCDAPLVCLTGFYLCDNSSVAGQCTFPRENAVEYCGLWDQCKGVTCNDGRSDCQARGSLGEVVPSGFTSYIKSSFFPYPSVRVKVHYDLYDGIPSISKWVEVYLDTSTPPPTPYPQISQVILEFMHVSWDLRNRFHAETAYMPTIGERNSFEGAGWDSYGTGVPFYGLTTSNVNLWVYDYKQMGPWGADDASEYYYDMGMNETLLQVSYPFGPGLIITPNTSLTTFRAHEILHDTDDLDRQALARKRMLRIVAPQTQADFGPWFDVGGDSTSIRNGADMASSLGFKGMHAGVDPFNFDPTYIAQVKSDLAYVHSKGIYIGFYVLLQNPPGLSGSTEAISPDGGGLGVACFATDFHATFRDNIVKFVQATGFDYVDTDGPYEAYPCASTTHEHHVNLQDSQFQQWYQNVLWYQSLPTMANPYSLDGYGIAITCPDPYEMASGTISQPLGYTDHWGSIGDRWEWLLYGRVYVYDGSFWKPPTNGLLPYDLYRAGSMSSSDDLAFYDNSLAVWIGLMGRHFQSGQLYQNNASLAVISKWMTTFLKYHDVINGDLIHVKKPTGRSWDAMMHVNPAGVSAKGFALFFNPFWNNNITLSTNLNVYYCGYGFGASVTVTDMNGQVTNVPMDTSYRIPINYVMPPKSYYWIALS